MATARNLMNIHYQMFLNIIVFQQNWNFCVINWAAVEAVYFFLFS